MNLSFISDKQSQFFNIKYPFKFQCPYIRAISCGTGENRRTSRHLEKNWQLLPLIYQWKISITASSSWSKWSFVLKTLTYLKRAICWGKSKGWITINHHSWKWSWKVIFFQINWLSQLMRISHTKNDYFSTIFFIFGTQRLYQLQWNVVFFWPFAYWDSSLQ